MVSQNRPYTTILWLWLTTLSITDNQKDIPPQTDRKTIFRERIRALCCYYDIDNFDEVAKASSALSAMV